ncbi:MAG: cyclic nucleotide-binding domain-containing protein [Pseudomonadota bacterium]
MSRKTVTLEQIILFLLETPMFEGLSAGELSEIVHIMQIRRLRDGQTLFSEGEEGDAWYVVFEGQLSVTRAEELGPVREITVSGPRACVGEMAVLDGSPRSATVTARGEATVFRFPRFEFEGLLNEDNLAAFRLIHEMAKVLCQRQRHMTSQLSELMDQRDASAKVLRKEIGPLVDAHKLSE